jgi:hypothetical protein
MEKPLRISFKSFEKGMNNFIETRIIGKGDGSKYRNEQEFPLSLKKIKDVHLSLYFNNDDIRLISKKLISNYKRQPFKRKSGLVFIPRNLNFGPFGTGNNEQPIHNFLITWNFENDYLFFKFFIRFSNGSKNKKFRQMKIKWI